MIRVMNLWKKFRLYRQPSDRLKEIIFRKPYHRIHEALKDISFGVNAGETLGIIGENGSGKSTLLKIITGVLLPDSGDIHIDGRVTGLLELGTGFNPEFTGIDNIYMNGAYIGLNKKEIEEKLDEIIAFAELGDFINEPIKTYSSGMLMRLAFSIAYHANPLCFVVDEALAVGDAYFQQKCIKTLKQFKENGGSIVLVSHDMEAVKVLCDRALLLEKGTLLEEGKPEDVINTYNFLLAKKEAGEEIQITSNSEDTKAYGNKKVIIEKIEIKNERHESIHVLMAGQACSFIIHVSAEEDVPDLTVGIAIRDRFGQDIFGVNTYFLDLPISMNKGDKKRISYDFNEFNIAPGRYTISVAAHSQEIHVYDCYEWIDKMVELEVVTGGGFIFAGMVRLNPKVTLLN